jgi:hypothetical protein
MFEEEAEEWLDNRYLKDMGVRKPCKEAYLAGLEAGIGKLRYCCTCKKWKECEEVSMYGICADWEIKE